VTGFMQNHRGVLRIPQGSSTEVSRVEVAVPPDARVSPEALRAWLVSSQHVQFEMARGGPGGGVGRGGEGGQGRRFGERADGGGAGPGDGPSGTDGRARGFGGESERGGFDGRPQGGASENGFGGPDGGSGRGERRGLGGISNRWTFNGGNARTTFQAEYVPGSETATIRTTVQSPLATLSRLHKGVGGGIAWILLSDSFAIGMVALGASGLIMWSRGRTPRQMALSVLGVAVVVLVLIGGSAIL
jgi:hypothetical protein